MDRDAEIDQIIRELEILRARYALYRRMGGVLKVFFVALIPLLAIGVLALAIKAFLLDPLYGVIFVGAVVIFVPGIIWLARPSDKQRPFRWIDFASQPSPYNNLLKRPASDAVLIEEQIVDRERRLSELG